MFNLRAFSKFNSFFSSKPNSKGKKLGESKLTPLAKFVSCSLQAVRAVFVLSEAYSVVPKTSLWSSI